MFIRFPFHTAHNLAWIFDFLNHCSETRNLGVLKKIHAHLLRTGLLGLYPGLHTRLIFTYTSFFLKPDLQTFANFFNCVNPTNSLLFNTLISDFCRKGCSSLALQTFAFMHANGIPIDTYALCSCLTASSNSKGVHFGKQLHGHAVRSGWLSSVFVGSALIDLYAKMLLINDAAEMFDETPVRNTVCANALLSGYVETKLWVEGLQLFRRMPLLNLDYDNFTFSATLRACTGLSAVDMGRQIHAKIFRALPSVGDDVFLQSSLIEMYGKCGLVQQARLVFNMDGFRIKGDRKRDVILWTSMLGVYGRNGYFKEVITLYKGMLMEGIRPDGVAFVTIISACAHTGQMNLGIEYFKSMVSDFGLSPSPEHYSCMVHLLCQAGELDRAWKLVKEITCCNISMWGALLTACGECGNIDLAKLAAQRALELDPQNVGIYVLLSNMYAKHGMWSEIRHLRELMKDRGLEKDVGCSWIEITS
ncbi:hypothetical protein NMG60_11014727 [Bertholletia excelsa]